MKQETIDALLRLAWLEGLVNTRGAYEKAVARRTVPLLVPPQDRLRLIEYLEIALVRGQKAMPLTVGALLKSVRGRGLAPHEIFARIGVSKNIYTLMEQDAISPLKIPAAAWRKLMVLLNMPFDQLADTIRRTCRLVAYRPRFGGMLARYKGKKRGKKKLALEKAYGELYARADLPLPPSDEKKLNELLSSIQSPHE